MRAVRLHIACGVLLPLSVLGCASPSRSAHPPSATKPDRAQAEALCAAGLTLLEDSRYAEAEEAFKSATDKDPFWGPAYNNLGIAQLRQGKLFDAAHQFHFAANLMPKAAAPRANLGILLDRCGQADAAEENLRAANRIDPTDIDVIGHLARLHVRQNKHDDETRGWLKTVAMQEDDAIWRDWAQRQLALHTSTSTRQGSSP